MRNLVFVWGCIVFSLTTAYSQSMEKESLNKLMVALETIYSKYVDSVDSDKLTEWAIQGIIKELDPHSNYLSASELIQANEPLQGNFEGIGIQFNILQDTIFIISPIAGGPSERLGIRAGDRIIKVGEEVVAGVGITNSGVADRLRGKKGTQVVVQIQRSNERELIPYTIIRDKIPIYSLDAAYMINSSTGYIKLNRFAASTVQEYEDAIDMLKQKGMTNLVLDLQGNGGGYLNAAIELSDHFLSNNKLIVYTEGKAQPKRNAMSTYKGNFEEGKLVVLIDEGSASASEIVTGAVQDWDRALVIGRRSFGKGLVQRDFALPDGSALRMTMARYYTPTGRSIQKPFSSGREAYSKEVAKRFENGELFSSDSIHMPDSLKFLTSSKRIVYGGGGILPDIFVGIDTSYNSALFRDLIRKGVINTYCLEYVDANRVELLKKYTTPNELLLKLNTNSLFENVLAKAKNEGIKVEAADIKKSKSEIQVQISALIARNLWDVSAFYEVINSINPTVKRAIQAIEKDEFQKLGLK